MLYQVMSKNELTSRMDRRVGRVNVLQLTVKIEAEDRHLLYRISDDLEQYYTAQAFLMLRERGGLERDSAMSLTDQQTLELHRDH